MLMQPQNVLMSNKIQKLEICQCVKTTVSHTDAGIRAITSEDRDLYMYNKTALCAVR